MKKGKTEFVDMRCRFFPNKVSIIPPSFNTIFAILAITTQEATELSRTTQWYFPGLHTLEVLETIITA